MGTLGTTASPRNPGERHESENTQEESSDCHLGLREDPKGPGRVSFRDILRPA